MKFLGLIALIPLLVVANPSYLLGKVRSIFDPPTYKQQSGYRPITSRLPASGTTVNPIRQPVPLTLSYRPIPAYGQARPASSSSYRPIPTYGSGSYKPIPVYVAARPAQGTYRPIPAYRLDVINSIIGGFWPGQSVAPKPAQVKQEEAHGHHFGYSANDGPETWPEHYPTCGGKSQSPIDIRLDELEPKDFKKLVQTHYWTQPETMKVENNGHSIQVSGTWSPGKTPSISGGPLNSVYEFKQMHIHWGMDDDSGSEHTVNGGKFPMELHVVHWNTKYGTYENAASKPDGLAVFGFFWDIDEKDNPMLEKYMRYTSKVEGSEAKEVKVSDPLPLGILNLECTDGYVSYQGSLTTPPCSEVVTWLVCIKPLTLSPAQMNELRTVVKDEDHEDIHNYRPTQPLNGRKVYIST